MGLRSHIKKSHFLDTLSVASFATLFIITILTLSPIVSRKDQASAETGTATPSTTELSITNLNQTSSINVVPTSDNGTFVSGGEITFSVSTNSYSGYALELLDMVNEGKLINTEDSTLYLEPIDDYYMTGNFPTNKWGIKPSKYLDIAAENMVDNTGNNATFVPFLATPTSAVNENIYGMVLDFRAAGNNSYSISLGAKVDKTVKPGAYESTYIILAIAPDIPYSVTYNKNTEDTTVANMPTTASDYTNSTTVTLASNIPTRIGYTFAGWCTTVSQTGECEGATYQPGDTYGLDHTAPNEPTLYAVWRPTRTMQSVYSWMGALSINESVQATDTRDNKVYWVTKLETNPANPRAMIDQTTGKSYQIWMTENLRLDIDDTKTYTHADTDLGYTTGNHLATWTPTSGHSTFTADATWVDSETTPYSIDFGAKYYYSSNSSNSDTYYDSLQSCMAASHTRTECEHYIAGYYYNWSSAVASNDTSALVTFREQASDSICPAGWTLPSGGYTQAEGYTDFATLIYQNSVANTIVVSGSPVQYATDGFNKLRSMPLWIVRAGSQATPSTRGSEAIYWTNLVSNGGTTKAISLGLTDSVISPNNQSAVRNVGFPVRCVARPTMQGATIDNLGTKLPNVGDKTVLIDARDGKDYIVSRIGDDSFWMITNLDLAGGTTLTPDTSNVAANYTLPASSASGFEDNSVDYVYNSGSTNCDNNSPCYSYYSFAAATAGTNPSSDNAAYDICPKGWRLPTKGEANRLYGLYNSSEALSAAPWYGVKGGGFALDQFKNGGTVGAYWTSTATDADSAYRLDFSGAQGGVTSVLPRNKFGGDFVRCVFKTAYMQDLGKANLLAALPDIGDSLTLYDKRDGKPYSVAKTTSGDVWMTTNLNLAGGTTLTPADSNVASNYTLPASSMSGFTDNAGEYVYNSSSETCDTNTPCYGYYSYAAATAGTNPSSGDAAYDICPKGWRLPTRGEGEVLLVNYPTAEEITNGPWKAVNAGYLQNNLLKYGGEGMTYWLSTTPNETVAYNLSSVVTYNSKMYGRSIRCILKKDDISMISTLQEFSGPDKNAIVSSMTAGQTYTLRDIRDGERYSIGKLADDKIWLLDNLRLDLTDATVKNMLSAMTTNASDNTLNYLKNGGGTTSDQYATAGVASWTSSYSYSAPLINTASKDTTQPLAMGQSGTGKVGVYYNYCAASAGSYCYGNGTSAGTSSGDATEDICPKGWRMPTGGSSGEYQALYTTHSSDGAAFINALRTPLSGYFIDGSAYRQGSFGDYWSSTRYGNNYMYYLYVTTSNVRSQDDGSRGSGHSVRCVLQ